MSDLYGLIKKVEFNVGMPSRHVIVMCEVTLSDGRKGCSGSRAGGWGWFEPEDMIGSALKAIEVGDPVDIVEVARALRNTEAS